MKNYRVMQGVIGSRGTGDYHNQGSFQDLEKAKELFDEIKEDIRGWVLKPNGSLDTYIESFEIDEDFEEIPDEKDNIIVYNQFKY